MIIEIFRELCQVAKRFQVSYVRTYRIEAERSRCDVVLFVDSQNEDDAARVGEALEKLGFRLQHYVMTRDVELKTRNLTAVLFNGQGDYCEEWNGDEYPAGCFIQVVGDEQLKLVESGKWRMLANRSLVKVS